MDNKLDRPPGSRLATGCYFSVIGLVLLSILLVARCAADSAKNPNPAPSSLPSEESRESGKRVGSNMLEQAIFDAFPRTPPKTEKDKRNTRNAADFVKASINAAGHLCARLIEVQEAAPMQYGIGCIKYRSGGGRANYLIDASSGKVSEI